jgi:brefeldin A-inhibited guanine nucleotide-exchange protein
MRTESGVLKFNLKPSKGLKYLWEHGCLERTPEAIAAFFHNEPGLDKSMLGDYMGDPDKFCKEVRSCYVERMEFAGISFDNAIRLFLNGFRLPGEAQKIDRFMEKFAEHYHKQNPGIFRSADAAFVLSFSAIMLNSDAHSSQIKNKMTLHEFIRNQRGIDSGGDIDPAFLTEVYNNIVNNEIKMKNDPNRYEEERAKQLALNPKRRHTQFLDESSQMVKKTQEHIGLYRAASNKQASTAKAISAAEFHDASELDIDAIVPMFEVVMYPSLAVFSMLYESSEDPHVINLVLEGYRYSIRISGAFNLETSRCAFINSLKKHTLLGSGKEMKQKNILAIQVLLQTAHREGNYLKSSWREILECISQLELLQEEGRAVACNFNIVLWF